MPENISELLLKLVELSKADHKHNQAILEKKKHSHDLEEKAKALAVQEKDCQKKAALYQEKEQACLKHEKYIKGEQEKLIVRRKSLSTLNDYKFQVKAEKEIEQANKQLSVQEDKLLEMMDQVSLLKESSETATSSFSEAQKTFEEFQSEIEEAFVSIDERIALCDKEREGLRQGIEPKSLNIYSRIAERYPENAIVPVVEQACTGCFFCLGAQSVVDVAKAKEMITCMSCGRILYLPEEESAEKE